MEYTMDEKYDKSQQVVFCIHHMDVVEKAWLWCNWSISIWTRWQKYKPIYSTQSLRQSCKINGIFYC